MSEKIQKHLAHLGAGSRRQIERWISEGRVKVDGQVAHLGQRVESGARIEVDGRRYGASPHSRHPSAQKTLPRVLIYYKPEGEVCTRDDEEGRPTVFERLPRLRQGRWVMVGRLDLNTSGLLLFTDHGGLANRLMHPRYEVEREYAVRVLGEAEKGQLERLSNGIELDDGFARFESIVDRGGEGANHWYHVTLREGRNREVRRLWEAENLTVSRLIRVRFGAFFLPRHLKRGAYERLEPSVVMKMLEKMSLSDF